MQAPSDKIKRVIEAVCVCLEEQPKRTLGATGKVSFDYWEPAKKRVMVDTGVCIPARSIPSASSTCSNPSTPNARCTLSSSYYPSPWLHFAPPVSAEPLPCPPVQPMTPPPPKHNRRFRGPPHQLRQGEHEGVRVREAAAVRQGQELSPRGGLFQPPLPLIVFDCGAIPVVPGVLGLLGRLGGPGAVGAVNREHPHISDTHACHNSTIPRASSTDNPSYPWQP